MAKYGYMAHDDPAPPVARSMAERMAACGVTGGWGENIAAGYATPASVVHGLAGLIRSSCEHREPELRLDGRRCGVERLGPGLLGALVLVEWERQPASAAAASAAASASASSSTTTTTTTPTTPAPSPSQPRPPGQPAPGPAPAPAQPGSPGAAQPAPRAAAAAASPLTFRRLTLTPRRPAAGHVLGSTVIVMKSGVRLKTGHVFCSAGSTAGRCEVLTRRLRSGLGGVRVAAAAGHPRLDGQRDRDRAAGTAPGRTRPSAPRSPDARLTRLKHRSGGCR